MKDWIEITLMYIGLMAMCVITMVMFTKEDILTIFIVSIVISVIGVAYIKEPHSAATLQGKSK